ncbi:MAG: hypothetical protein JNM81_18015 [Rhodospirillaceae bacterium]|nr:hypothetical protein [Rhodospirillaceae bacterium]
MPVSSMRATLYAVLFGLAVAANVYLWNDAMTSQWRELLAALSFVVCMGLMKAAFVMGSGEHMSEHQIKTLGAEE